jgi:3-phenylpropionate/trans-cinnamate dioxygenase ferredoxin subunit
MGAEARYRVGAAADMPPGERRVIEVQGRSIGLFNVGGRFYALHNGCPHRGGPLCEGRVGGTTLPGHGHAFAWGHEGRILRCAWHGWEFDITTGRALVDPAVRARSYPVAVEDGDLVITL